MGTVLPFRNSRERSIGRRIWIQLRASPFRALQGVLLLAIVLSGVTVSAHRYYRRNFDAETVEARRFNLCSKPPHFNCVIDGDTFYYGAAKIRLADIDAPETHPPRCAIEAALGIRATQRLQSLLNGGAFQLVNRLPSSRQVMKSG